MSAVFNKKHGAPDGAVYIGRPSKWGNPFWIGKDGDREEVIGKYSQHLVESGLINEVGELAGKDLVCWCSPLPCHGDILLRLANGLAKDDALMERDRRVVRKQLWKGEKF